MKYRELKSYEIKEGCCYKIAHKELYVMNYGTESFEASVIRKDDQAKICKVKVVDWGRKEELSQNKVLDVEFNRFLEEVVDG